MMNISSEPITIKAQSDNTFFYSLLCTYQELKNREEQNINHSSLSFDFTDMNLWISANSLCLFLSFLDIIMMEFKNLEISINILNLNVLQDIYEQDDKDKKKEQLEIFVDKVRFFHVWNLPYLIYERQERLEKHNPNNISLHFSPNKVLFYNWLNKLNDFIDPSSFDGLSSTFLPISILENETSLSAYKSRVDRRISNITNILWTHIYGRYKLSSREKIAQHKKATKVSTNIMYELVKNILQHSGKEGVINNYGHTTVQVLKRSLLFAHNNKTYPFSSRDDLRPYRKHEIANILGMNDINETNAEEALRYLSISIVDFGVGIANSVKEYYNNNGKIDNRGDIERIEEAIFTSFTSKSSSQKRPEFYLSDTEKIPLSPRGYGWIYCALFISARLGRFNVSTGNTSVTYSTTVEGREKILSLRGQNKAFHYAEQIFISPNAVFSRLHNQFSMKHVFPGTRILIEIPIDYRWFEREKEYKDQENKKLHNFINETLI